MGATQAPNGLQPISVGGQLYYVDSEAIQGLKDRGIAYDDGSNYSKQGEDIRDLERGAIHGATLGLADKKFGTSNESIAQRLGGEDYADVAKRSPVASSIGDFAGSMAVPVPGGAGGALGRIGTQAAIGAGTGAARAFSEDKNALEGAGIGGALGAAGSGLVEGAGKLAQLGQKYGPQALDAIANSARTRVFGIGGSDNQLQKLAERFGVEKLPEKLASMIEGLVPQQGYKKGLSQEQYRQSLDKIIEAEGPKIGELRTEMGSSQGVDSLIPDEWKAMRQTLQSKLDSTSPRTEEGRALIAALQKDIKAFDELGAPKNLNQLADIKSEYQAAGHSGKMGTIPDSAAAESAALIGREGKDTLNRLTEYALPETAAEHTAANDKFAKAALLRDQITPKAIRSELNTNAAGNSAVVAGTLGGALVGGAGGLAEGHPLAGAASGAGLGLALAAGSGTRNYLSQLLAQPQAMDTIANIARAAGKDLKDLDLNTLKALVQAYTGKIGGYAAESD